MANITPASATNFIPEIWAQSALEVLRANVVAARLVMTDSQVDGTFRVGDTLNIPFPGTFTANTKTPGDPVALQAPTDGVVSVVLDAHREVSFLVEDIAQAQANQSLMDLYIAAAVPALAEAIESRILALVASAGGTFGTYGTAVSAATLLGVRSQQNIARAPQSGRVTIMSPKDEVALLGDEGLATYFANARPDAIANGSLGQIYGQDLYMSQLVPTVAGTPLQTRNLSFHRNSIVLAMRGLPTPPEGSGARASTVRDPETGLALRVVAAYNPDYLGMQVTVDVLFGVKIARAAHVIEVRS